MNYIINIALDYADEFCYPFVSILTERQVKIFTDSVDLITEVLDSKIEIPFGSNESINITTVKIIELVATAKEITDEELIANDDEPGKGLKRELEMSKPFMPACTALEIVKFFKLKVYAAKFVKPVPTTEVVLNDGIDSKEAQDSNI